MSWTWIQNNLETWVAEAVRKHFPEDELFYDARMTYFPQDGAAVGVLPMVSLYVQINGTVEVDGLYLTQMLFPSTVSAEMVENVVQDWAAASLQRRADIRASLARGDEPGSLGVPLTG